MKHIKTAARFVKTKIGIAIVSIVIGGGAFYFFAVKNNTAQYQFVTVTRGSITETVSVTGNTTPVTTVSLAFENSGTIAAVHYDVGNAVSAGSIIAKLDTSDLDAQLAQAQASVDTETAKLKALQVGPRPEDIQISQTALTKARQDLANLYGGVNETLADSYAKANDAVRNQLNSFFTSAETNSPQLTFSVSNSQVLNNVQFERIKAGDELNAWQTELAEINAASPTSSIDTALRNAASHLADAKNLLTDVSNAVVAATNLSASTANTYKTDLTAGLTEINTAATNVNTAMQDIAAQDIAVSQAQAQLDLTLAGSTQEDIDAQAAQVEQAQASVQSVEAKIQKASMVAPVSGVITQQDAKVGQIAMPSATLVTIISSGNLEVDAEVPEVDIGKVNVGDPVAMTFDAFPGETFAGKVFYIDPAETIINGVVDYKIKVSFDKADPRVKSGLTVNLDITTQTKNNALILPQFAILQNDQGTFVETLVNKKIATSTITLGISDQSGNVEILSGATEGEQVLNIGLK